MTNDTTTSQTTPAEYILPVQPAGRAGLFDVDPDQSQVDQSPDVATVSDIPAMPEDMEV